MTLRMAARIRKARARGATEAQLCDIFQVSLSEVRKALQRPQREIA